jgi:UDP:flavonoid glycosyltransferase YjiC (YdhE family)
VPSPIVTAPNTKVGKQAASGSPARASPRSTLSYGRAEVAPRSHGRANRATSGDAGPLGITRGSHEERTPDGRPRFLLGFSTTVLQSQVALIQRVCDALAGRAVDAVLTLGPAVRAETIHAPRKHREVRYADHDQLLPHTDAVVTHGGLGTTLRALAHGKPLLLLPLGRDQQFNAGRVVELGAGISMPADSSPTESAHALLELRGQPRFRSAAEAAAAAIAHERPDETAAAALSSLGRLAR